MKKTQTRKVNRHYSLENPSETFGLSAAEPVVETQERNPLEGEVDIEGALQGSDGGFRVNWTRGNYGAVIEENVDGEWRKIGGVQKLTIEFDVDSPLPVVTLKRIIT